MNMDDKKIDELINKALQEEQALPEGLSRRLEKQIDTWASTEEKKPRSLTRRRTLYWLSGVAAYILLCISFFTIQIVVSSSRPAQRYLHQSERCRRRCRKGFTPTLAEPQQRHQPGG